MSILRSSSNSGEDGDTGEAPAGDTSSPAMPGTSDVPSPTFHLSESEVSSSVPDRHHRDDHQHHSHHHDDDDEEDRHRHRSSNHLHPQHHQQQHLAHQRALNSTAHRARGGGLLGTGYGSTFGESVGIGGSGSFSGGSDVGAAATNSKSKKRPVIRYLPSAGGVKKLGLAAVASESVVTGSELRRNHLNGSAGQNPTRPHKPGVVYQVASDFILERNLGLDLSHKPIALHEVASETAMALKTGHCKLHRDCSLQGPSWQNLCIQQQQQHTQRHKEEEEKGCKAPSLSIAVQEGKGVEPVSSNTTIDALSGSMMSVSLFPFCRICHMAASDSDEPLISPCRCSGTMQYIHGSCLMKWMDICSRKSRKTQRCELCHYQYSRQKRFQFKEWKMPRSSRRDKLLHAIFLLNLIIMIGCAVATVYCFLSDTEIPRRSRVYPSHERNQESSSSTGIFTGTGVGGGGGGNGVQSTLSSNDNSVSDGGSSGDGSSSVSSPSDPRMRGRVDLSSEEVVTLCCGVLFFISFFVAMYAQIKAKHTLYQLFVRFTVLNTKWEIEEYDPANDPLLMSVPEKIGSSLPLLHLLLILLIITVVLTYPLLHVPPYSDADCAFPRKILSNTDPHAESMDTLFATTEF